MSKAEYVESTIVRQLRGVYGIYRNREFGFGSLNFANMAYDCANEIERLERENAALRAQEQNEPLTCDGCQYDRRECPLEAFARCDSCVRQERVWMSDRYEPKGADQ